MRAVVQRVSRASVRVGGETVAAIGAGLLVLVGVGAGDEPEDADFLAEKVVHLRIFPDDRGRFDRSLLDVGGAVLAVSNFTLYGDTRRGRRPGFTDAAPPERAEPLFRRFAEAVRERGVPVQTGVFGARMEVELVNDGPVTLLLESAVRSAGGAGAAHSAPGGSGA